MWLVPVSSYHFSDSLMIHPSAIAGKAAPTSGLVAIFF
jgi:hypothetical protein